MRVLLLYFDTITCDLIVTTVIIHYLNISYYRSSILRNDDFSTHPFRLDFDYILILFRFVVRVVFLLSIRSRPRSFLIFSYTI